MWKWWSEDLRYCGWENDSPSVCFHCCCSNLQPPSTKAKFSCMHFTCNFSTLTLTIISIATNINSLFSAINSNDQHGQHQNHNFILASISLACPVIALAFFWSSSDQRWKMISCKTQQILGWEKLASSHGSSGHISPPTMPIQHHVLKIHISILFSIFQYSWVHRGTFQYIWGHWCSDVRFQVRVWILSV